MKWLFRWETVFFTLVWLRLIITVHDRRFLDPGVLWPVKVGEIVTDPGRPQTDPFSCTFEGERWVPQPWGAEILVALVHRASGFGATLLCFATGWRLWMRRADELIPMTNHSSTNTESVCLLLRAVADAATPGMLITLVLGNARYQKCVRVSGLAGVLGSRCCTCRRTRRT